MIYANDILESGWLLRAQREAEVEKVLERGDKIDMILL